METDREQEQPVDIEKALKNSGGYAELLEELVGIFLDTYPDQLDELHVAIETGDAEMLHGTAHSLKSSIGSLGAERGHDLALELERAGSESRLEEARSMLEELEEELESIREFFSDPGWKSQLD